MRWGLRFVLLASVLGLVLPGSALAFGPLSSFGGFGAGPGQLDSPGQIALGPDGDLYVVDSGNRIEVFAGDGSFLRTIAGQMDDPQDVAIGSGGRVYVADKGNDRIDVFSTAGEFLFKFGEGKLDEPIALAVSGFFVYVSDGGNNRVVVFGSEGGTGTTFVESITPPRDMIVGRDGDLYFANSANKRVDVYTPAGIWVRAFGESGPGALEGPVALALDDSDGLYVADQLEEQVAHFSEAGGFLGRFPAEPNVSGVATACGGNVFATEQDASFARVVRFGEPGTPPPPCKPIEPELIVDPGLKPPSNKFHFAGLKKNRANGFAVLYVRVPGPGKVSLKGRGFRRLSRTARQATTVSIPIKPKVRLRHFLKQHGKGRIRVEITFTPTGGEPRMREKVIVLRRERMDPRLNLFGTIS